MEVRLPPVGTMVNWYRCARTNEPPHAALVMSHLFGNLLGLKVFRPDGHMETITQGVRHVRDPFHEKKSNSTMRYGGWDDMPDYEGFSQYWKGDELSEEDQKKADMKKFRQENMARARQVRLDKAKKAKQDAENEANEPTDTEVPAAAEPSVA